MKYTVTVVDPTGTCLYEAEYQYKGQISVYDLLDRAYWKYIDSPKSPTEGEHLPFILTVESKAPVINRAFIRRAGSNAAGMPSLYWEAESLGQALGIAKLLPGTRDMTMNEALVWAYSPRHEMLQFLVRYWACIQTNTRFASGDTPASAEKARKELPTLLTPEEILAVEVLLRKP